MRVLHCREMRHWEYSRPNSAHAMLAESRRAISHALSSLLFVWGNSEFFNEAVVIGVRCMSIRMCIVPKSLTHLEQLRRSEEGKGEEKEEKREYSPA